MVAELDQLLKEEDLLPAIPSGLVSTLSQLLSCYFFTYLYFFLLPDKVSCPVARIVIIFFFNIVDL